METSSGEPPASPSERIHAARYLLIAAAAMLLAGSGLWGIPLAASLGAMLILVAVTALPPRRSASPRIGEGGPSAGSARDATIAAILDALSRASFLLDAGASVRYANRRAAELFPATRPGDAFTLTFRSPELGEALSHAQAGQAGSADYHAPGEATRAYSVAFAPLSLAGDEQFILVTFEDVSDRLAIARMRSDFVANASHELRTPLASLTGFIETLLGPARNDPQASEKFLKIMLDQARRMRRLLDDLLSLSRLEMRVHRRPTAIVDLAAVARHVADALAPLAEENAVTIAVEASAAPVNVLGDRDELVQVVQNLVENAIRYGASGGRVDIAVDTENGAGAAAVHVQDYGPGIAADHLPRLTERFYRVDVGASREMKGTGLGLAIVKHILTRHEGRLDVRSKPGEGARFTVLLPRLKTEAELAREKSIVPAY